MIPCMIEPCERPNVINFCHTLDYFRAHGYWDYWKKLRDSIIAESVNYATLIILEIMNNSSFSRATFIC